MRRALFFRSIICRSHGRGNVSTRGIYIRARGLAVCFRGRLRCWRVLGRRRGLLHGHIGSRLDIDVVRHVLSCRIQFAGSNVARLLWWTGCAAGDALVLHGRDHRIIGRRHYPVGRCGGITSKERINYTWDGIKMRVRLYNRILRSRRRGS